MNADRSDEPAQSGARVIQLNSFAVTILCAALLGAGCLAAYAWMSVPHGNRATSPGVTVTKQENDLLTAAPEPGSVGPWGELFTRDIELEQPQEYALYDSTNSIETWTFEHMDRDEVRAVMTSCGVPAREVEHALSPGSSSVHESNTAIVADDELAFSLTPETREKLYKILARFPSNPLMQFPICFRQGTFEPWFKDGRVKPETVSLVRQLLYQRGAVECFSDLYVVLSRLASDDERTRLTRALSHQNAVLVALRIRSDTDVDKMLGYWDWPRGVRLIDTRPLLEALKRVPNGGAFSILYFLPQFARQRLYTYPLPAQPSDPAMDCHWSTMNFFNETPDDRFANPAYTSEYLRTHYYEIAKPSAYGDLIMIVNEHSTALHSAVYLAGNIVFTKNGNNFRQPWMLMRLEDLVAMYASGQPVKVVFFRNKDW